jgi:hypothetical protein
VPGRNEGDVEEPRQRIEPLDRLPARIRRADLDLVAEMQGIIIAAHDAASSTSAPEIGTPNSAASEFHP